MSIDFSGSAYAVEYGSSPTRARASPRDRPRRTTQPLTLRPSLSCHDEALGDGLPTTPPSNTAPPLLCLNCSSFTPSLHPSPPFLRTCDHLLVPFLCVSCKPPLHQRMSSTQLLHPRTHESRCPAGPEAADGIEEPAHSTVVPRNSEVGYQRLPGCWCFRRAATVV